MRASARCQLRIAFCHPSTGRGPLRGSELSSAHARLRISEGKQAVHARLADGSSVGRHREARAGKLLGPYEILGSLGKGGMGEVYRARDTRLGRDVAIKVVVTELATDPESAHRYRARGTSARRLWRTPTSSRCSTSVSRGRCPCSNPLAERERRVPWNTGASEGFLATAAGAIATGDVVTEAVLGVAPFVDPFLKKSDLIWRPWP
jgi:serine/threonine protein kinase